VAGERSGGSGSAASAVHAFGTRGWLGLAALGLLAAGLRAAAWLRSLVIFNDGPRFLQQAELLDAGEWGTALADPYHPLYAALTAGAHRLGRGLGLDLGWEAAAVGVSIAGGVVAMGFLFGFVRDAFGETYAWITAALYAVHSRAIEFSSDVQSEGVYLACFLASVWMAWRALTRRSPGYALASGLAAGVAYWTRPEGLGIGLVAGALLAVLALWQRWEPRTAGLSLGALALGMALCVGPYAGLVQSATGDWALTHKKPLKVLLGAEAPALTSAAKLAPAPPLPTILGAPRQAPATLDEGVEAAMDLFDTLRSSLRPAFWVTLIWGVLVAARGGAPGLRAGFVASVAFAYLGLLMLLVLEVGYVSRRHTLPPLLPAFGYAAIGVLELGRLALRGLVRLRGVASPPTAVPAAVLGCTVVAAVALSHQWEPRRLDKQAERRAAQWLGRQTGGQGRVAGSGGRIGYYSRMEFSDLTRLDPETVPGTLVGYGIDYAVVHREEVVEVLRSDPRFRLVHEEEVAGERSFVFRLESDRPEGTVRSRPQP